MGRKKGRLVTFIHPHSFEGLLQMQKLPLQKIFIATLYSPLRTHEDAKSSNMRKSVQVLHLFPFISLCTSPVGVYRIKIFVGVLLFSFLLSTLSLFQHFLTTSFSRLSHQHSYEDPLMNTGAYLELSDLPEAFQPCLRFYFNMDLYQIFSLALLLVLMQLK